MGFVTKMFMSVAGSTVIQWVVMIGVGLLFTAAASSFGYAYLMKREVQRLNTEQGITLAANAILEKNAETLTENNNTLREANSTNLRTIEDLLNERKDATKIIAMLSDMNARDKNAANALRKSLAEMAKDPTNDGSIAPILRETIRNIQNERAKK